MKIKIKLIKFSEVKQVFSRSNCAIESQQEQVNPLAPTKRAFRCEFLHKALQTSSIPSSPSSFTIQKEEM